METIIFTVSLLILIIAVSASAFFPNFDNEEKTINLFILISMILVGVATPLNIFKERQHNLTDNWKKNILGCGILLFVITLVGSFSGHLEFVQYIVIGFLSFSIILSMFLIRSTKPIKRLAHREKIERILAMSLLIVVPISLMADFYLSQSYRLDLGFLLPLIFIVLAVSKIWDDLERLSLFKTDVERQEQNLKNYALTEREQEIALFLTKGMTYKQISEQLHIAIPTVKTHTSNIYRKCGVKNKNELTFLLIK